MTVSLPTDSCDRMTMDGDPTDPRLLFAWREHARPEGP